MESTLSVLQGPVTMDISIEIYVLGLKYEPVHEKTNNLGSLTQTSLYTEAG